MLSIIIPAYNNQFVIDKCLKSILEQDYKQFEVIVVDDGSQDKTEQVVQSFAARDARVRYIKKENGGVSSARNMGLDISNGDYVAFVDADDTVEKNIFKRSIQLLEKTKSEIAFFDFYNIIDGKKIYYKAMHVDSEKEISIAKKGILLYSGGYVWNKVIKKKAIGNIRFDEKVHMCEDLLFLYRVLDNCNNYVYIDEPLYDYIQNSESICNKAVNKKTLTFMEAYEAMLLLDKSFCDHKDIMYLYMNNIIAHIRRVLKSNKGSEKKEYIRILKDKAIQLNQGNELVLKQKVYIGLLNISPNIANVMYEIRDLTRRKDGV